MGDFEKREARVPSADALMDSVTPSADQLADKEVKTKKVLTTEMLETNNPGYKKVKATDYPQIIKRAKEAMRKENKEAFDRENAQRARDGKPPLKGSPRPIEPGDSAKLPHAEYNSKTKKIDETFFVYGVGPNGEHLLVKGPMVSRKPNKEEQASMDAQQEEFDKEDAAAEDEELAAHVAKVLKEEYRGKAYAQINSQSAMAQKVIGKNQRYLKQAGGAGIWNEGGKKYVAINVGGGKVKVYEG